jgi:hypothetical protein
MAGIDRGIGLIEAEMRRDRVLKRAVFVVTSSEAVTPLTVTLARKKIDAAVQAAGAQTIYFNSDGMAMIGLSDPTQALPVAQAIDGEHILNVDAIYFRTHAGQTWTYQAQYLNPELPAGFGDAGTYLLNTIASAASPDVVVAYSPDVGTDGRIGPYARSGITSNMQWPAQHIPLVLSGQGVFPGVKSAYPARLIDIAPTIEALLGIEVATGDGNVLADSMYNPPGGTLDRQRQSERSLAPLVLALKQRTAQVGG